MVQPTRNTLYFRIFKRC